MACVRMNALAPQATVMITAPASAQLAIVARPQKQRHVTGVFGRMMVKANRSYMGAFGSPSER